MVERAYRILTTVTRKYPLTPQTLVNYVDHRPGLYEAIGSRCLWTKVTLKQQDQEYYITISLPFELIQRLAYFHNDSMTSKKLVFKLMVEGQFELLDALVAGNVVEFDPLLQLKAIMRAGTMEAYNHYDGYTLYGNCRAGLVPETEMAVLQHYINTTHNYELNHLWICHEPPPTWIGDYLRPLLLKLLC